MIILCNEKNMTTINISDEVTRRISPDTLEKLLHSEAFGDILFWYEMIQSETWEVRSFKSFKESIWM